MVTFLILLVLIAAFGAASALGLTADTRDPEYGLGRILDPRKVPPGTGSA